MRLPWKVSLTLFHQELGGSPLNELQVQALQILGDPQMMRVPCWLFFLGKIYGKVMGCGVFLLKHIPSVGFFLPIL